jgi:GntR family transcriptional regulator
MPCSTRPNGSQNGGQPVSETRQARAPRPPASGAGNSRSQKLAPNRRAAAGPVRVPAYRQITTDLAQRMNSGEFHEGAVLPGEADLASEYGVSRMTVRQALSGLAELGLVERRRGMGTIVRHHKLSRQLQRPIGLTEEIRAGGQEPGSHVLRLEELKPPATTRFALWLGTKAKVILLRRLRYADGVLIGTQDSYIPASYAPGLTHVDFENRSLSATLRDLHGLVSTYAELTIESIEAEAPIADVLEVPNGTALLRSTSVTFLPQGRPLEQTIGWFLGSRYSYRLVQGTRPGPPEAHSPPTGPVPGGPVPRRRL